MNYLIKYKSSILFKNKVKELLKDYDCAEITNYSLLETPISKILLELNTYSLFSNSKCVIIDDLLSMDANSKDFKDFINYLENPIKTNLIIMTDSNLISTSKVYKEVSKYSKFINLETDPTTYLKDMLKDYKISFNEINLILKYTLEDIDSITNECLKLYEYKEKGSIISKEDIEKICFKRYGDSSKLSFELVRYIGSGDSYNALKVYNELKNYMLDDIKLMGLIENELRTIKTVSLYLDNGYSILNISKETGFKEFRIKKTIELLSYVNNQDINNLIKKFALFDLKIKSGEYIGDNPLELFILNI